MSITQDYEGYETNYPDLLEISNRQLEKQMWFASEVRVVEEDRLEMLYKLSPKQQFVVKSILPTFRKYEVDVSDFWTDVYPKFFKAPECKEGAAVINMFERAVHARFYDKINKVFGTDNDEHYLSYLDDPIFKDRAKWIGQTLNQPDMKQTCLCFGMIEGVSLFNFFALLRSFQTNGYNLISSTVKGTKQSAMDELLHSEFLAKSFNYYYAEQGSIFSDDTLYFNKALEQAYVMYETEKFMLISLIGNEGFNGTSTEEYLTFIRKLIDNYFVNLGCDKGLLPFKEEYSKLEDWFNIQTKAYAEPDFFGTGKNKEYEMAWNKEAFVKCWSV